MGYQPNRNSKAIMKDHSGIRPNREVFYLIKRALIKLSGGKEGTNLFANPTCVCQQGIVQFVSIFAA